MIRWLVPVAVAALLAVGSYSHAYQRGVGVGMDKATKLSAPHGVVVWNGDGTCSIFDKPGQKVQFDDTRVMRAKITTLMWAAGPVGGAR